MIRFWCECGRQLQAREADIGRPVACPICGKTTTVAESDQPRAAELRGEEIQTSRAAPPADDYDEGPREPRRRRRQYADERPVARATSGLAIAALVLGILSFPCFMGVTTIPAIILGILALGKIAASQGRLGGKGSAIAGVVLGFLGLVSVVPLLIALLLPAVQNVRDAAARQQEANNLKQMAIAMHNYHSAYGTFPAATTYRTRDGKPALSWRVALLPFIEEERLYKQFKLDEPWDSPNNIALLPQTPKVYLLPGKPNDGSGLTHYQVFVGPGTVFQPKLKEGQFQLPIPQGMPHSGMRLTDITDGTSNTFLIATARNAVPWTKPDDIPYDPNLPIPPLGGHLRDGFQVAFADGTTRWIRGSVPESTLRLLITANDGAPIPPLP
jgi:hypothetical protein